MQLKNYLFSLKQYYENKAECDMIKQYRNLHKGKRCFIIGTGPSLTPGDLNKLQNEITFGTNRIFEVFSQTEWRPTYYMNQDYKLICTFSNDIAQLSASRKFMPIEAKKFFAEQNDISYFVLRHKDFYPHSADFSTNISKYLGQGFTVTYGAVQMAYYMGFSKVYLLGIDHNYSISLNENGIPVMQDGVTDYFKGSTANNKGLNLPRVVESTMAYMTARKFADAHKDFTIYNATRGGKLESFERVDLDEVLNEVNDDTKNRKL